MKNKSRYLIFILTVLGCFIFSVFICLLLRQRIVSVDLIKILNAQAFYSNKMILRHPGDKNWMHAMAEKNRSIREKIRLIAGKNTIVMVAPSVVQGADDITDRVLVALGLPNKLPDMQAFAMPSFVSDKAVE